GAADVMEDDEAAVRLEPRRDRPLDVAVVEDIDVLVDDHDLLHRGVRAERRHDRVLPVSLVLLPDRHDAVEPGATAFREADRLHVRHRAADRLVDDGFARHPHEHEMLIETADDDVKDRLVAVVDPVDDEDGLFPNAVVRPDGIDERSFVVDFVDETALQDILGVGGHRKAVLDADHVDGLAEARLRQRGRDPALVDAVLDGRPAGEEVPWVQPDAHRDLEFLAGVRRLVVHVTQVAGHDAARASILAQEEDAMEREVPHALPLGDPDPRRDITARVLRDQLRDREFAQVDVQRLVPQKFGAGHDPRAGRLHLPVHELGDEIPNRHSMGGGGEPSGGSGGGGSRGSGSRGIRRSKVAINAAATAAAASPLAKIAASREKPPPFGGGFTTATTVMSIANVLSATSVSAGLTLRIVTCSSCAPTP